MLSHKEDFILPPNKKGILSFEEVKQKRNTDQNYCIISSYWYKVFMYVDVVTLAARYRDFVACSFSLPLHIAPRKEIPSGLITTLEEYESVFEEGYHRIESLNEFVDFLNVSEIVYRKSNKCLLVL